MNAQDRKLFDAIADGDVEAVLDAIENGADVNARNELGQTPIECAILNNDGNIAERLAECNAANTTITDDLIIYTPEQE